MPRFLNIVINLSQNKKFLDEFRKVFGCKKSPRNFKTLEIKKKGKIFEHFSMFYRRRLSYMNNLIKNAKKYY